MQLSATQLRAQVSGISDADDALLEGYASAAEAYVQGYTRRDLDTEYPDGWPADIVQVLRMIVAHFYRYRELVTDEAANDLPIGVRDLLAPYRDFAA